MVLKKMNSFLLLGLCLLVPVVYCSLFNPHKFPSSGPFFEGWYLRITDFDTGDSLGALFGHVLPDSAEPAVGPLVLSSILSRSACNLSSTCTLTSSDAAFRAQDLRVTSHGRPISSDPDVDSAASFEWNVQTGNQMVLFEQTNNMTRFNFSFSNMSLYGEAGPPVLWRQDGAGPEGWLWNLPLPLHWFVFSLRSPLRFYQLTDLKTGIVKSGNSGAIHLEKNWGQSFPRSWIWSQGVSRDDRNISFALSGGHVDLISRLFGVDAYLFGYRNPGLGLAIDFRPDNSILSPTIDGCSGNVIVTARSWSYKVKVTLSGTTTTYSRCLYGPKTNGFRKACVESYDATADIEVSARSWLSYKLVDRQRLDSVALEFGGTHVCGDKCNS